MIRGPKNVAEFRDDDHRYRDPLPACDLAPAMAEDAAPFASVTTILGETYPAFLDVWKVGLAADHAIANAHDIVKGHIEGDLDTVKADIIGAPDRHRDAAAARGTDVHRLLETMLDGGQLTMYDETSPAWPYVDQIRAVSTHMESAGAVLVASEVMAYHRGIGWAGTFDAVWTIGGQTIIVDYKSRKATKAATRYDKEAAQLGGYAMGEYWIVQGDDGPRRIEPMNIDAGLIVSIAPDDVRYYAVDITQAAVSWDAALTWRTAKAATIGAFTRAAKDLTKIAASAAATDSGGGEPAHHVADVTPAATRPQRIEPTEVVDNWTPPAEGKVSDVAASQARLTAFAESIGVDKVGQSIVNGWLSEGDRGRRPWRIRDEGSATARRMKIYGAAIRLASWTDLTDDHAAGLVGFALGEELQPAMTVGMALGCLTAAQAATLSKLADLLRDGAELETVVTNVAA